jgi:hypothetical protein
MRSPGNPNSPDNVISLRSARNMRPLTPAQLRQREFDTQRARLRWVRFHVTKLAAIAVAAERTADDLAEAARLGEDIQLLLNLYEPEE